MFKQATKTQSKLRAAFFGPSGSGKTYSALRVATGIAGIGGKIAVICTERGSAAKYSDRFSFDVCDLEDRTIAGYCTAIAAAGKAGYAVLVIDSLSHAWQQLLEKVEKLAQAKYRGNTWSAWSEGTPEQQRLIDTLLDFPGHIIATMRSRTEWTTEKNQSGRSAPMRVGLAPEQGKGIEYEFDLLMEISTEHLGHVLKDRTGKFQDALIDLPGEDFGQKLAEWLADGEAPAPTAKKEAKETEQSPVNPPQASHAAEDSTQQDKETTFTAEEQSAFLEDFDAAVAARGLDLSAAQSMLAAGFAKLGSHPDNVSVFDAQKCLNALRDGKWDEMIKAQAAKATDPPTDPPTAPEPTAAGKLPQETMDRIAKINSWLDFLAIAREMAPDVPAEVFDEGIKRSVEKIQRTNREESISPPRRREWAIAIAMGKFNWATGIKA